MSSNDMPELGSKISLISKADIRYEGKLYTVDPQDCTIALANVRSFGTEDRKTAHPVPAQNQIYDYILFRATDIKDISVVPPTQLLCDPAIVQLSSSLGNRYGSGGSGGGGTGGGGGQQDYPSQMLGGLGGGYHHSGGSGGGGFNPMQSGLNPLSQQSRAPQSEFPVRQTVLHHNESVLDFLTGGGGSRSSTPALRKPSPTVDQSTQANSRQPPPLLLHKDDKRNHMYGNRNQDMRDNRGDNRGNRNQYPQQQQQQQQQQRSRTFQQYFEQQLSQNNMMGNRGGWPQHNMQQQHQQQQHRNQNQQHQQQNGRIQNRPRNGRQFARAPGPRPKQPVQPLKFESDYDFDKANSEFEELKSEISKLKLSDNNTTTSETPAPLMNGDAEKTNKDDSGNETALATDGEQEDGTFYNKNKSFFDNISCEAIERSKGRSQRTDWRKERMLNSETFGVATARRGMYRGGRGGGNYYFGGNRGGYYGRGYRNQQVQQRYRTKSPAPARPQPQTATA